MFREPRSLRELIAFYQDVIIDLVVILLLFAAVVGGAFAIYALAATEAHGAPAPLLRDRPLSLTGQWDLHWQGAVYRFDFRSDRTVTGSIGTGERMQKWQGVWNFNLRTRELSVCEWRVGSGFKDVWIVRLDEQLTGKAYYLVHNGIISPLSRQEGHIPVSLHRDSPDCTCSCRERADCRCKRGEQPCAVNCSCLASGAGR